MKKKVGDVFETFLANPNLPKEDRKALSQLLPENSVRAFRGFFEAHHHHLAKFYAASVGTKVQSAYLLVLAVSLAKERGHLYLPLEELISFLRQELQLLRALHERFDERLWNKALGELEKTMGEGNRLEVIFPTLFHPQHGPLILESGRLCFQITWQFKQRFVKRLSLRLQSGFYPAEALVKQTLERVLTHSKMKVNEEQQRAIIIGLSKRLCLITGGPGTGKTSTATALLRTFLESADENKEEVRIALAAATGRAASRLAESISTSLRAHPYRDAIDSLLPTQAFTLHQLLGIVSYRPHPKYDPQQRLPYDLVLIDEASMADLKTFTWLLEALEEKTHLVLLGDEEQLPSIEAGSLLSDFSATQKKSNLLSEFSVTLTKSYRFKASSKIAELAKRCQKEEVSAFIELLQKDSLHCLCENDRELKERVLEDFLPFWEALKQKAKFERMDKNAEKMTADLLSMINACVILSPMRQGPMGSARLNDLLDRRSVQKHYSGQIIMITENDYETELFNGERGLIVEAEDTLFAAFSSQEGSPRLFKLGGLPPFVTAYAMTVHKSQGSEYEKVSLLIGKASDKLLTREILYTGITRAKKKIQLYANEASLRTAIQRRLIRYSGLAELLTDSLM